MIGLLHFADIYSIRITSKDAVITGFNALSQEIHVMLFVLKGLTVGANFCHRSYIIHGPLNKDSHSRL